MQSSDTASSALAQEMVAADSLQRSVLLAKTLLVVNNVIPFEGKTQARTDYLVGLCNVLATTEGCSVVQKTRKASSGVFYTTIKCSSRAKCQVLLLSLALPHRLFLIVSHMHAVRGEDQICQERTLYHHV